MLLNALFPTRDIGAQGHPEQRVIVNVVVVPRQHALAHAGRVADEEKAT